MSYVEGYVVPVETGRMAEYEKIAAASAKVWKELGALSVVEAKADNAPVGELTSFPRSVMLRGDETVIFSYITFRDRAHRDQVMDAAMKDARMMEMMKDAPVDGKRMIWGGFTSFVAV